MNNQNTPFVKGNQYAKNCGRPKERVVRKFHWDVQKICEEHGFNPFEKLIELASSEEESIQLKASAELASYIRPKLKQIDFKGDGKLPFVVNLNLAPHKKEDNAESGAA